MLRVVSGSTQSVSIADVDLFCVEDGHSSRMRARRMETAAPLRAYFGSMWCGVCGSTLAPDEGFVISVGRPRDHRANAPESSVGRQVTQGIFLQLEYMSIRIAFLRLRLCHKGRAREKHVGETTG